MGFDNLTNAWTALFPLAVLLYYFFRKRYETMTISSTLFWEQSMRETKVSPYLKNLQRNALFYLQMAALLLLLFVLLGPFINKEEVVSGHTIMIVDTSASMLAGNVGNAYFLKNKDAMKELAAKQNGQPITIITTGKEPAIVIREETDGAVVSDAIDKLTVTYEYEHMERAIEFAKSVAAEISADIHIYTDSLDRASVPEGDNSISWTVNGSKGASKNVSIDKFGAVKNRNGIEAIIKLVNKSNTDIEGQVRIVDALSNETLAKDNFVSENGKDSLLSFKELPASKAITAEIIVDDDYDVDNSAFIVLGHETTEAVVDGKLHSLVKKAFEAVGMSVTTASTNELLVTPEGSIVVTNDVTFLEKGNEPIILIGRNDSTAKPISGVITRSVDPLFTIANIDDVYISAVYPPFEGYTTIATVGDKPFIQKSERGDIVILADIEMTDWPLHPSFPLFIWSSAELLSTGSDILGTFVPNERKAIISGGTTGGIEVYTMDDEYVTTIATSSSFIAPAKPGIYKAREGATEKLFSVQLERFEKEIAEGTSFSISRKEDREGTETGKNMIGSLLLLPILLLMLVEWEVQRRRGYPN